jgi:trimeric autotransporter adhesin
MRRFLTLVCLLVLAVPAGISISGCYRNPAGNYCNGLGYGPKITTLSYITLGPQFTGISLAFGQTRQSNAPAGFTCKNTSFSVSTWSYGTTNNQLVDISPTGNICAGTWNRNSGGGIADYTICSNPNPLPSTSGVPYGVAYVTASADGVTSNPVPVYVHAPVTSITLAGPQQCLSQNQLAQLDSQACYSNNGTQTLFCAPSTLSSSQYACPLPAGVTSVPTCESSIGTMSYTVGTSSVASINAETNQITAELPGTTVITASLAGSGSTAGYFSTCPPANISVTLNGATSGTVTQGVQQNLVTNVTDTQGNPITGLTLTYQSTNPQNLTASSAGAITASFPGSASVYAICQPSACNPAPINEIGVFGTGLPISSNPVDITVPGTASAFVWYGAPGQSQYFIPYELLSGTPGSTVRLPYVPNSMMMDRLGTDLYFGSQTELMVYSTSSNAIIGQYTSVPGVVLAVEPSNGAVLVNDQKRQVFYLFSVSGSGTVTGTFGGLGTAAQWTPDSQTLYVSDSAAANNLPANIAAGIMNHTDTLYVYNANTGWTTYPLPCSNGPATAANPCTTGSASNGAQSSAIMVPSVGAYFSGNPTVAHTWCPAGNVGQYANMLFYPQIDGTAGDSVPVQTDRLAATNDGDHILGAAYSNGGINLTDIAVTTPSDSCLPLPAPANGVYPSDTLELGSPLQPLLLSHTTTSESLSVNATAVNQVVTSPAAITTGTSAATQSLSFVTYDGTTAGAKLPYYLQTAGPTANAGTVGYVSFQGSNADDITAPIAGAFSADNTLFFVSTAGDNQVHYINTSTLQDTQQVTPNLPACTPVSAGGTDAGCTYSGSASIVPATVITVKPRATN